MIVKLTAYMSIDWGPWDPNVEIKSVSFLCDGKLNYLASLSIMKVL